MEELRLQAYAKVNLTLDVGPRRADGYHEIHSVMQTVSLADELFFSRAPRGISVECDSPDIPAGSGNLAGRALEILADRLPGGIRLEIRKRIPVAAGLGGGSSDAAAALKGADRLYGLGLTERELLACAAAVGSDVPFFILGGTVEARGRGEVVRRLPPLPVLWLVLAKPDFGVSTAEVYAGYKPCGREPRTPRLIAALEKGDGEGVLHALGNDLEEVTAAAYPKVGALKARLEALGALKTLMTGSGPAVYGIFPGEREARLAARELRDESVAHFVCRTVNEDEIREGERG
ncbi:MAG TPA: 4-(cytidine 5'-diphospho)-2-C-methyl-D-erythritol kinase [Syntrophomonadaceae bacterium]|nr:4-(cytidine 5'-diphospho)-2-C-methyl-D-erythritol kinase [Syntrophomonadaceae bacterium]